MLKSFYLPKSYDKAKGQGTINDLNNLLAEVGVNFKVGKPKNGTGLKLFIYVDEEKLKTSTNIKVGRPVQHELDIKKVNQMKADGKTNKEIYTELGMSKSLFYLKMREYKNNNGL